MRRGVAVATAALALLGGYGAADVLDVVPGILTLEAEPAAYPVPLATATATRSLPMPSAAPSGMPLAPAGTQAPLPSTAGITAALAGPLADPDLKGAAVVVRDALTGTDLYAVDPGRTRIPASTLKLVSALAVQRAFPAGSTLSTAVLQGAAPDRLVLVAGGDMLLSPDRGDPGAIAGRAGLADLADAVAAALRTTGTTAVTLAVDAGYAPGTAMATGWSPDFRPAGIVGPVAMLGLASHWPQLGKPAAPDPVAETAAALAARLTERGIATTLASPLILATPPSAAGPAPAASGSNAGTTPGGATAGTTAGTSPGTRLGEVRSAPVTDLVGLALERSDNTLIESLARQAAYRSGRPSDFEGTAAYLRETLGQAGIDVAGVSLHDASGLSRSNALPARVLADVLTLGAKGTDPGFTQALTRLPVAALTGTLGGRFTDPPHRTGAGIVRAKTGSLTGVNALAGTVVTADGRLLVFVVLQQGPVGTAEARGALDGVGAVLATCGCR